VQQRTTQVELEHHRGQVHDLMQSNQQLQSQVTDLEGQLDRANSEASSGLPLLFREQMYSPTPGAKHQLEVRLVELELSSSSVHSGMNVHSLMTG
jgi:hypothetical protein